MILSQIPQPPIDSADLVENQFYEALQFGDIDKLMAVWADDEGGNVCVHPGGPRVMGTAAIRASFEAIFAHGAIPVRLEDVRRIQSGSCAVHSVLERIDIMSTDGPKSAWVFATNVYLKTLQGWRMVSHHASPGTHEDVRAFGKSASLLH